MGQSTNGQICFGVSFPEDFEFPWDVSHEGDIEEWWKSLKGFVPLFEMWDAKGNYKDGKKPSEADSKRYYDHQHKWEEANPIPVELVNTCSCDYPKYIVAVPGTEMTAYRGDPKVFDPSKLTVTEAQIAALNDFIDKYIDTESMVDDEGNEAGPKWYLSSLWC